MVEKKLLAFHNGQMMTPEQSSEAHSFLIVGTMSETGGKSQRCSPSQSCARASIASALSEKSFEKKRFSSAFRSLAKASTVNGP